MSGQRPSQRCSEHYCLLRSVMRLPTITDREARLSLMPQMEWPTGVRFRYEGLLIFGTRPKHISAVVLSSSLSSLFPKRTTTEPAYDTVLVRTCACAFVSV